jgi:hypothetical protein
MRNEHKKTIKIQSRSRKREGLNVKYSRVPSITLSGLWLERQGFSIGERVEVRVKGNQIILTKIV